MCPARCEDPSTIRTERRVPDTVLVVKGKDELARGRVPEPGGFIRARRENPGAVRTERSVADLILMVKGGHKLARGRIPELGAVIRVCRQDPRTVRAECSVKERTEMFKGSDELARSRIPKVGAMIGACRRIRVPLALKAAFSTVADGQVRIWVCPRPHPKAWRPCLCLPSGSGYIRAKRRS